ncbi:SAM-dependent methyltransferase [Actinopolymorpha pittospori]|uniref:SAM-dependent MidA family methyltransferase n=1 Tax=Actinopolymorpha pittospori TaxID=648752 RepID=A0A927R9R1_9ACTN|nr:SAM-dependent methyltransferase [Actinopolymorpha pittospori]MBE1606769.1 SAM-dependent MidA family methyltransferase [Actinopolymorpha pittospori]
MGDRNWRTWRVATEDALYGVEGFFRTQAPSAHFRTSVHVSRAFSGALQRLARAARLDTIVDVGAGRGELLHALHDLDPSLALVGVEVADRPPDLPASVGWTHTLPEEITALVIANEWLDDVPLDVAEVDADRVPRLVEVDVTTGQERLGERVSGSDADWLDRWWPLRGSPPGSRAEIGLPRDRAWAAVVRRLRHGIALAIDYGHLSAERPALGTLTGYRSGRLVAPLPDRSCDITAHVAIDAVDRAGATAGADSSLLTTQREALMELGLNPARPPLTLASSDPAAYLSALSQAGETSELVARGGLGDFWWLAQGRGVDVRQVLGRPGSPACAPSTPPAVPPG